jgi:hypothetical protein
VGQITHSVKINVTFLYEGPQAISIYAKAGAQKLETSMVVKHTYICDSSWKFKLIYDRQSVGQSVLVSGPHQGLATNFSFSLKSPSESCGFVIL